MAKQTRGNALLNAYMNRYMNEQASAVNSGEKNIASAASQGAQQISAVPTNLPELTDFSSSIYSSILNRDKEQRAAYEQAVKEAKEAAEKAAKSAAARTSTRKSSGRSSYSSGSGSYEGSAEILSSAKSSEKDTAEKEETKSSNKTVSKGKGKAVKNQDANKKTKTVTKKGVLEIARELDEKQQTAKRAQQTAPQYAAAGNRAVTTQSTDVGLASSYGAYAQSRAAEETEKERQALAEKKAQETAKSEAERKTTLANLQNDKTYLEQLAKPGVKLSSAQQKAVKEYLDEMPDNRELAQQYSNGEISFDEYNSMAQSRSLLEQKTSLGGFGQDLQAFTAGIYNSVPMLETLDDAFTDWANKETGGKYGQYTKDQTFSDVLQGYEAQNPVAGMAGRFAGNAAMYGAANAAMEGNALANAASAAGGKIASALKSVPGIGNFVTDGTGAAIGNIITGQTADLALDTIPSLAGNVYDYTHENPDNLTPGQIATNTAGNFGINLAMNVGSEAIPALWRAGKNAVTNSVSSRSAADTEAAKNLVQAYENNIDGYTSSINADALTKDLYEVPSLETNGNAFAEKFFPNGYTTSSYEEIPYLSAYDFTPQNASSVRAKELTGRGRQSQYTRQIENIFDRVSNGESADAVAEEAASIARSVYKPTDFTTTVEVDPAIKELRDYVRNTPIKIGQQEAGDLLSSSGYKNISEYNKANGTRFSITNGVDWDTAVQELNGMNVGVQGNSFDDLMQAVVRSKTRAEKNFDEDMYNTYVDYVRDSIVAGPNNAESFEDWIETQGFDYNNLPDYQQRAYDRWQDGTQDLPQTAKEGLPEYGIGAKRQEYPIGDVVPNRDYAAQAAARQGLDEEHAAAIPTFEHRVWTDKEAQRQALEDINTAIQSNGGDFDAGMEKIINDLRDTKDWDKGNIATAQEVRNRLRTQFQQTQPDTPEFYRQQARYNELVGMESAQLSKAGQNLQAESMDAGARVDVAARRVREQWAKQHGLKDSKLKTLQDELDRLSRELNAIKQADVDAVTGMGDAIPKAKTPAGDMNKEFGEFLETQGIKTDPTEQFNDLVTQVKKMCGDKGVKISDDAAKEIAGAIQNGASKETYYNTLLNEAAGITDLSMDELAIVDDLYSKAATLPDSKERYDLEQQALQIMAQHLPAKSWFERFDNIRYLAMLGNTRTHARNLIGNVMMSAVSKAKDEVSAAMQLFIPQNQRTRALYTPRDMKQAARDYLNENAYSALRQGGRYNLAQGLERVRSTYGNSPIGRGLQRLSDLNSKALEKEDEIFLQSAFVRSLASNLTAKGYDTSIFSDTDEVSRGVLYNAVQQAITDAKDATFRADNALTEMLGKIGNLGDKKGSIGQKVGYMITNGLLPFTKTPANILKTSLEYTPVGGIVEAAYRGATGKGSAAVADALAKGIVGTGLMGVGWYLADAGLVTAGQDEDTEAYNDTLGTQNYSVRIPGVGSYTIDWAAPSAVPFLTGAALAADGIDLSSALDDPGKLAGQFGDIMMGALDPVTEMSLLSSVNDFLDSVRYGDENALLGLVSDLGTSYFQQFIPTALGQVSRAIDPLRRSTYGGGDTSSERDTNYLIRSTLNKIPGLSQDAEPYIDQWGRTEASLYGTGFDAAGIAGRLAYNMLSPGYFAAENVTPVDSYIQELYSQTGDSGVIPELAPSYVSVDGTDRYFTPEEKTEYATTRGQLSYSMLEELQNNSVFTGLSESQQAEIVKDVYDLAKKVGASAAIPELDYSDNDAYSVYQELGQSGAVNYLLGDAASSSALADKKTSTGNENASLNDYERWEAVSSLGLDESSTVNAFLAQTDADSKARKVYDAAGESGVTAYLNAYGKADTDSNGTVSETEMLIALAQSGLDAVTLYDTYTAYAPANNSASEKAQQLDSRYGTSAAADWLEYMANYNYAYQKAKESVAGTDEKVSQQSIATSVLNQLGYDNETKRLFWQMTGSNWAERNNPF